MLILLGESVLIIFWMVVLLWFFGICWSIMWLWMKLNLLLNVGKLVLLFRNLMFEWFWFFERFWVVVNILFEIFKFMMWLNWLDIGNINCLILYLKFKVWLCGVNLKCFLMILNIWDMCILLVVRNCCRFCLLSLLLWKWLKFRML